MLATATVIENYVNDVENLFDKKMIPGFVTFASNKLLELEIINKKNRITFH